MRPLLSLVGLGKCTDFSWKRAGLSLCCQYLPWIKSLRSKGYTVFLWWALRSAEKTKWSWCPAWGNCSIVKTQEEPAFGYLPHWGHCPFSVGQFKSEVSEERTAMGSYVRVQQTRHFRYCSTLLNSESWASVCPPLVMQVLLGDSIDSGWSLFCRFLLC